MSKTDELAVAVIGLGFGANHARVLSKLENVRLAAVCDTDSQRLADIAKHDKLATYVDYRLMLEREQLDAVVVAVPAHLHLPVGLAVIEAGCPLLVEKPLAPTLADARTVVEAATKANVSLMPGHIERFNPAVRELARRVCAEEIGAVSHLSARRMGPIVMRTQDVNVIHDTALHDIDSMRYVLGSDVTRVFAEAQSGLLQPFEDSLSATLRFDSSSEKAGAIGSLEVNWLSPLAIRDLMVLGEAGLFQLIYAAQSLKLYRPKASAHDRPPARGWVAPSSSTDHGEVIAIEPREPLREELMAFIQALRDGTAMPVSGQDALAAVAVADALTESARSNRPVEPARV